MKKFLIILALFTGIICSAQNISVSSFKLLDTDLTANTAGTMVQDQNGETAAIIKVVTTQTGFTFDGGSLGIVKTVQKPSEIWVYVPKGLKKITISHPQLGMLRDYYFNIPIEAGRSYEMVLITGEMQTVVKQARTSQYVVFQLTPPNSIVELNGEQLETSDGIATKLLKFGTYNYRVNALNYLPEAGNVTINDPDNKHFININLKPNFTRVTLNVDNGAEIWVNGEQKGFGSWTGDLGAGTYEFETRKQNHRPVEITHDIVVTSEPQIIHLQEPMPIYGEADINSSPAMADIYIDGVKNGQTPQLISNLLIGQHTIEIRKEGYGVYSSLFNVVENQPCIVNAVLNNEFTININCNNPSADLYIDGKSYGKATGAKQIEIGKHLIEIKPEIYSKQLPLKQEIIINGEKEDLYFDLEPRELNVEIKADKPNAYLFIDGKMITNSLNNINYYSFLSTPGIHEIAIRCKGEKELNEKVEFSSRRCKFHASFKNKSIEVIKKNNSNIIINAPQDCSIYINDIEKGKGTWKGQLNEGVYIVEARKESHTPVSKTITVNRDEEYNITMPTPSPIYGVIEIASNPIGAKIIIDNKESGVTPSIIDTLLIGKHKIRVTKKGYSSYYKDVNIEKGKTEKLNVVMEKQQQKIDCSFEINDNGVGTGVASTNPQIGYNNKKTAYIRIIFCGFDSENHYDIECGNNGIVHRENDGNNIHLYVNEGVSKIIIKDLSGIICDYIFPIPIKGGRDYVLNILLSQKGKAEYENGCIYEGFLVGDMPNGKGTIHYPNGDTYEGELENGIRINGKHTYANGLSEIWFANEPKEYEFTTIPQNTRCTIRKIERTSNYTKIHMAYCAYGNWCAINSKTYITTDNSNNRYDLIRAEGIAISPEKTESHDVVNFVLTFPPLPKEVQRIDLIEPGESSWKFYNIKL